MESMLKTQNHLLNHVKGLEGAIFGPGMQEHPFFGGYGNHFSPSSPPWTPQQEWTPQPRQQELPPPWTPQLRQRELPPPWTTQPRQELPPLWTTQTRQQQEPSSAMPGSSSRSPTPPPPPPKRSPLAPVQVQVPVLPSHHAPPLPIPNKQNNTLPSSAIEAWPGKKSIRAVIEQNHKLTTTSKVSTLAVRISRDAVFGEKVMKQCTALGGRDLPGLPREELYEIKKSLFDLFPMFWKNKEDFESVWAGCIDAIGQACKRLRHV